MVIFKGFTSCSGREDTAEQQTEDLIVVVTELSLKAG